MYVTFFFIEHILRQNFRFIKFFYSLDSVLLYIKKTATTNSIINEKNLIREMKDIYLT